MELKKYSVFSKALATFAFLVMIVMNVLANSLPLNGQNTGQVSDSYPNIFAPAGITFAVWGLIYFLLALYTLYQLGFFQKPERLTDPALLTKISIYFIISSFANAVWIFAWHFNLIPLSMILMVVILLCLILVNDVIGKSTLSKKEKFFLKLPFSVYFGWITVATIANVTTLLVSFGWNRFGISEAVWASIIITVGMIIGLAWLLKSKDIAYGLVLIWAYLGIYIKHTSSSGFNNSYPSVIAVVSVCIAVFIAAEIYISVSKRRRPSN
jgi:hypothetical protein